MKPHQESTTDFSAASAWPPHAVVQRPQDDLEHHGLRTGWLATRMALALGLDEATVQAVTQAAYMHDTGKNFVAEAVLYKPGRLDRQERRHMEMHVVFGAWALIDRQEPRLAAQVALLHHEWWNGQGYPFGLSGDAIPLAARITAVADVFDALSQERCYKPAWPQDEVMRYLSAQRGRQFDPGCADAMHEVAAQLPADWHMQALSLKQPQATNRHTVVAAPEHLSGPALLRAGFVTCIA